jgi:L-fuculose-phosphate aldolase
VFSVVRTQDLIIGAPNGKASMMSNSVVGSLQEHVVLPHHSPGGIGPMSKREHELRREIVEKCRWMNASGLNQGTSGNISARCGDAMLITPSGVPYDVMTPDMIALMPLAAADGAYEGPMRPSSEWQFHRDILRARPEIGGIVHTHSPYATALAIARRSIPACHYMIAAFGGSDIRCAGYARYGTSELSRLAVEALEDRLGCLLANHGMIAIGTTLERAMALAVELETLARQYYMSLLIGGPVLLTEQELEEARAGFATYGQAGLARPPQKRASGKARTRVRRA